MSKPLIHAQSSVKRYGGVIDDYLPIHDFMDSTKAALPDVRHRAILHSSFGIYIVERVFGTYITNADQSLVSVRDIAEDHVLEDLGTIPTLENWLSGLAIQPWMGGKRNKTIPTLRMQPKAEQPIKHTQEDLQTLADAQKKIREAIAVKPPGETKIFFD